MTPVGVRVAEARLGRDETPYSAHSEDRERDPNPEPCGGSGRTVIYRSIENVPTTSKRSALAEPIREGLWLNSERQLGDTSEA